MKGGDSMGMFENFTRGLNQTFEEMVDIELKARNGFVGYRE